MLHENFVYVGAILTLIGSSSYVLATLRGEVRPNRVTWFLWAAAPFIAFAAQVEHGVGVPALMTFMTGVGPAVVFVLSFFAPAAPWRLGRLDFACGALSVVGLLLWAVTREGNLAIACSIAADALAAVPTMVKSFRWPRSESALTFWLAACNGVIALLTLDRWGFADWAFPAYIVTVCVIIGTLVTFRVGELASAPASLTGNDDEHRP